MSDLFRKAYDPLDECALLVSSCGTILACSRSLARRLERSPAELTSTPLTSWLEDGSDLGPDDVTNLLARAQRTPEPVPIPVRLANHATRLGGHRSKAFRAPTAFVDHAGSGVVIVWVSSESGWDRKFALLNEELEKTRALHQQIRAERDLAEQRRETHRITLEALSEGVLTAAPSGKITFINDAGCKMLGLTRAALVDCPVDDCMALYADVRDISLIQTQEDLKERIASSSISTGSFLLASADGGIRSVEIEKKDFDEHVRIGSVFVLRDVTADRINERQLEYQATHDHLTGLTNRHHFEIAVKERIARRDPAGPKTAALIALDLDRFKLVNDSAGHAAGDQLLRMVSEALRRHQRSSDVVVRLGGDEFAMFMPGVGRRELPAIITRLIQNIASIRIPWGDGVISSSVSVGATMFTPATEPLDRALQKADMACYVAKNQGRNQFHIFTNSDELNEVAGSSELEILARVRSALEQGTFFLEFQTIQALGQSRPPMVEALLRIHDAKGLLMPGQFIPLAETYDLMPDVDAWVVHQVLERLGQENDFRAAGGMVSVNVSGRSLNNKAFLKAITETLKRLPECAHHLVVEITETAALESLDRTSEIIGQLSVLDVHFAIDDFGSGYSSFSYLKALPVSFVKIDGEFVRDMRNDRMSSAMIRAINEIAHSVERLSIAEYVEDEETLVTLRSMGVDYGQGFLLGHPTTFEEAVSSPPLKVSGDEISPQSRSGDIERAPPKQGRTSQITDE
ncbi:bifunctional diguanylate cyclase/phosphodiesterase [Thioalkalivibrio sp. ALE9]|uniref:putative bifunctional diguanylate cyclase/phosphodiesterase n=1 Tax=Thioalkalivibrio sp. ALE9 TaxID=1158169 RepID=UPI001E4C07E3|nr:EAL domain-containing protein [Thioalkalivibrio sp. ALE9]